MPNERIFFEIFPIVRSYHVPVIVKLLDIIGLGVGIIGVLIVDRCMGKGQLEVRNIAWCLKPAASNLLFR